ncbi:MAG: hypothetical protein NC202_11480 [Roseburia sp.]|nr:hypothetical protein [Roseburia sp.]
MKKPKLVDRLYANLLDMQTNNNKIAGTKIDLEALFRADRNTAIRVLARTILMWYGAVTVFYMNGKFGFPLKRSERAELGEQFRTEATAMTEMFFTGMTKKISSQENAKIRRVIQFNLMDIEAFLGEYSRYLTSKRVFCIRCQLCDRYFLTTARNTRYCVDCKVLRKKNSKKIYAEKMLRGDIQRAAEGQVPS